MFVCVCVCGIAGSYVDSTFNLLRNYQTILNHFTFPPAISDSSNFTTSLPTLVLFSIFLKNTFFIIAILVHGKYNFLWFTLKFP